MKMRRWCALIALLVGAVYTDSFALAQFPSKPLRIVVPFPPSGSVDVAARALAPPLTKAFGQSVVVDNRPGAGTVIGTELVARAPADGHTFLIAGFTFIANAALRTKLPFDSMRDFVGVARIGTDPYIISVHPSLPVRTARDIVALARANPGQLTYATNGAGSAQHVTGEMLKQMAKIDMIHVPYQGGSPAAVAVLGGHTTILISTIAAVTPHLNAGKLRAIAVTSQTRSDLVKDVPTMAESGYPDFELTSKLGAFARSPTPKELINRLGAEIVRALQIAEVRDSLFKQGISATPMGPAEYDAIIRAEIPKIQKIVRDAGIRLD
ncbi:MAG: tripartite tricarboxylate transporter substrate binding protein [Burkholderiales bacterium]